MAISSILNLTQHNSTPEQKAQGVVEPSPENKQQIQALLTFSALPTQREIMSRATVLAEIADGYGCDAAMIGGAPYLMSALEHELRALDIQPLYSFTLRESVEEPQPDGSVRKVAVFRHVGFVEPPEVQA